MYNHAINHKGYSIQVRDGRFTAKSPDGTPLGEFDSEQSAVKACDQHAVSVRTVTHD